MVCSPSGVSCVRIVDLPCFHMPRGELELSVGCTLLYVADGATVPSSRWFLSVMSPSLLGKLKPVQHHKSSVPQEASVSTFLDEQSSWAILFAPPLVFFLLCARRQGQAYVLLEFPLSLGFLWVFGCF
jgi:hypothetical protein